ncbi:GNAT family N-acetyltransferase [Alkalicoccobacillus murimartini]|uniref:RimJ/RimL family protein N-acetyltransferase n=1 Tax=Alkalicoccobacillus murimartini TaxID=171685 RepID=A0ABT9YNI7_9BACI|nr:GNAT family protein [Alkalicoccobacillus murimartini]MDQ0208767.1 RimJ/RimL family protein N-acetyltransferase [Alkalicoccobacillus murimartini]
MKVQLQSKHIGLCEFKESDWEQVHDYASQKKVCQYQTWGPNSIEDSKAFVKQIVCDSLKHPRHRYAFAIVDTSTQTCIGCAELLIRDRTNKSGEIAYIVHPNYWGQGIATEAAKLLLELGYEELKLHRIFAKCDPRNQASAKVMEKIGMIQEGRLRENLLLKDGTWRDSWLYSMLEQEYKGESVHGD